MSYRGRVRAIEQRLGDRRLVYFGTRGSDARPLTALRAFDAVFSQIAPLGAAGVEEVCLETLKCVRVDLNRYSIDLDPSREVLELRRRLLDAFGRPAAVLAYRPTAVLASAWFPRADRVLNLGLFHEHQACFDHKPWVETQLAQSGVRVLPWTYYGDDEMGLVRELAARAPVVVRSNRSDGGTGLSLVRDPEDVGRLTPPHRDGFVAVAPFLDDAMPLNLSACVFPGGEIALHPVSLQVIGVPLATTLPFGYCGNDFARARALPGDLLDAVEDCALRVGRWMAGHGYLGAFGIDALVHHGQVYLTEVNPRFQGSSFLSSEVCRELDRPDLFLDHVGAFLGLPAPEAMSLRDMTRRQSPCAHVVCHNTGSYSFRPAEPSVDGLGVRVELVPDAEVAVAPQAILFDARFDREVTADGSALLPEIEAELRRILRVLYPAGMTV